MFLLGLLGIVFLGVGVYLIYRDAIVNRGRVRPRIEPTPESDLEPEASLERDLAYLEIRELERAVKLPYRDRRAA